MVIKSELEEKLRKYKSLTEDALKEVKIKNGLNKKEERIAKDFLDMANRYFNDAKFFEKKGKLATALAAYSYAHAWLDAGARAKLFDVKNSKLFASD